MSANLDEQLGLRLQEEHTTLMQLNQVLKEHIAVMPNANLGNWLAGLRVAFDRLYAHIERCMTMKEKDGYLEVILKDRPSLSKQVAAIKSEHGQLLKLGAAIRDELATMRPEDHLIVGDACARTQRFMAIVDQHDQRENMIVLFALNQDLGGH